MISTIMTSYLGHYEGARKNPEAKFIRAVESFIAQDIAKDQTELVIVSDGCQITNRLYQDHFEQVDNIQLIQAQKSKNRFPGENRQIGIDQAKFDIITYLDSDDFLLPNRLNSCVTALNSTARVLAIDTIYNVPSVRSQKITSQISTFNYFGIQFDKLEVSWHSGTSQLVHQKNVLAKWDGKNSRGEDHAFFTQLCKSYNLKPDQLKRRIDGYVVCHHPQFGFDV
jgi:glycosyltransferase involved in cell wall biosynthesis